MSRPLNRAPIESSLEMKCMFLFFITLSIVIAVSFLLYWLVTRELAQDQSPITANMWSTQHLMEKHWYIFATLSKSEDLATFAPSIQSSEIIDFKSRMEEISKRIRNQDCRTEVIQNPAKLVNVYNDYYVADPEKVAAENQAKWDKYAEDIQKFYPLIDPDFTSEKKKLPESRFDSNGVFHYFEEIRMDRQDKCVNCHGWFGPGELMGVIHVEIEENTVNKILQKYWAYLLGAAIVSVFLAMVSVNLVVRWVVLKPLRTLQDVSDSISRGELSRRAEIRTGDEFEVLSEAFNRMLRHLVNTQDMLRKANNELESKVDELAHLTIQLYETNRVKSDFMATMSHELRTPLNSILGFSDVLGSISTLSDKQKRYVENINKSGRSLLSMINDILDMAKMDAGRMEIHTTEFNIASTVAAQADMAKPLVDRKNIDLDTTIEPDLPPMKQDESRIQQILNNLLSNAIKFTPEGGRIQLSVQRLPAVPMPAPSTPAPIAGAAVSLPRSRDMLEVKVSDTGVGISEDDQMVIFEKFRQGKTTMTEGDTMKREHSGSGLGLSIVKEICKMLEGEIFVESQLGIGSTFTVRLPWTLQPKARTGSEMTAEIQQFAQNRVVRQRNRDLDESERVRE